MNHAISARRKIDDVIDNFSQIYSDNFSDDRAYILSPENVQMLANKDVTKKVIFSAAEKLLKIIFIDACDRDRTPFSIIVAEHLHSYAINKVVCATQRCCKAYEYICTQSSFGVVIYGEHNEWRAAN